MLWLLRSMSYATLDDLCDRTLPARHPADNMHACIQASDSHMAPNRDVYGRSTAQTYSEYMADPQQTYSSRTVALQPTHSSLHNTYVHACMQTTVGHLVVASLVLYLLRLAPAAIWWSPPLCCTYCAWPLQPSRGRLPCDVPTAPGPCSHLVVASLVLYLLRLAASRAASASCSRSLRAASSLK